MYVCGVRVGVRVRVREGSTAVHLVVGIKVPGGGGGKEEEENATEHSKGETWGGRVK